MSAPLASGCRHAYYFGDREGVGGRAADTPSPVPCPSTRQRIIFPVPSLPCRKRGTEGPVAQGGRRGGRRERRGRRWTEGTRRSAWQDLIPCTLEIYEFTFVYERAKDKTCAERGQGPAVRASEQQRLALNISLAYVFLAFG
eukprot:Gb_25677 [translate_table: standard]